MIIWIILSKICWVFLLLIIPISSESIQSWNIVIGFNQHQLIYSKTGLIILLQNIQSKMDIGTLKKAQNIFFTKGNIAILNQRCGNVENKFYHASWLEDGLMGTLFRPSVELHILFELLFLCGRVIRVPGAHFKGVIAFLSRLGAKMWMKVNIYSQTTPM